MAGLQAGGDIGTGTRSSLMWNSVAIIKHVKPKFVVWENVKNVLSKKHKHNFEKYLKSLEDVVFKRALVFLRRAFTDFSANEKSDIAENLGQIWGIEPEQVANILMSETDDLLNGLNDFDFSDI